MVKKQMFSFNKSLLFLLILIILSINTIDSNSEETFDSWLTSYKKFVLRKGVSKETIDLVFKNVKYLEQVIVYDRKQLEGMKKARQRGQTQYVIPNMPETRDPRLQRSRFRKIVRYTKQELPRYREEYKTREAELQQLRIQEKASTKQYSPPIW